MFHYTNFSALKKIVESKSLLATHVRYVNDTKEFVHACDILIAFLHTYLGELPRSDPDTIKHEEPIAKKTLARFQRIRDSIPDVFVSSFSNVKDDLSQWRGYTKNGNGVCVGFNRTSIKELAEKQNFVVADCEYQHEAGHLKEQMTRLLRAISPALDGRESLDDCNINILAAQVKHHTFEPEKEVRLIHIADGSHPMEHIGFPRVRFDLSGNQRLCISEVCVCPSPDLETSRENVKYFLRAHGIEMDVQSSLIPYRSRPT